VPFVSSFKAWRQPAFRFEYGRHGLGKLRTISLTGGLLRLSKPLVPGILGGPVIGLAELLIPALATLKCLQLFKFIVIDDDDYQRLSSLILSSVAEFVPLVTSAPEFGRSLK
jgi:hypothetical protein